MVEIDEYDPSISKYEYEPTAFLKCHSKIKGDKNDRLSRVWMCAFEPHPNFQDQNTNIVATCGGASVCVMNVKTGEFVTKYYSKDLTEDFYSLSWSTLFMKNNDRQVKGNMFNVLAVAGAKCTVHLLHPERHICFLEEKIQMPRSTALSSLQFHPLARNVLCGGFSDGQVYIWDLGGPSPPDYDMKLKLLFKLSIENEIINMTFSRHCETLLAATEDGVQAWTLALENINKGTSKSRRFNFPSNPNPESQGQGSDQLVDSVVPIENGKLVATKCALHGVIYVWNLEDAIQSCDIEGSSITVEPLHILNYSKTDNYYMSMGSSLSSGLLVCGDDKGHIWLYDLKDVFSKSIKVQDHSAVIPWPKVIDPAEESLRKIKLNEVVMNKVIVDYKGSYIVAVTNTNLVCIWKKERSKS